MITVNENGVRNINASLLSIDSDIKASNKGLLAKIEALQDTVDGMSGAELNVTPGSTYDINITGNASTAATADTATKVANSLVITNNGTTYTYDGSSAVSVPIATSIASALTTNITNTYSNSAVGTTTYNGSADVANNIYLPNQSLNSTDSPTFNTVTAALSGNATTASTASKVANALTIGRTVSSSTTYNGSATAAVYSPGQALESTSSPAFTAVSATLTHPTSGNTYYELVKFRDTLSSWDSGLFYDYSGNERIGISTKNSATTMGMYFGTWIGDTSFVNTDPSILFSSNGVKATTFTGSLSGNATAANSLSGVNGNYSTPSFGTNCITAGMTSLAFENSDASWAHYLIFNHGNGETYYNYTLRLPFQGIPQYQRRVNGTLSGWSNFITSENIGSQSVSSAETANKIRTSSPSSPANGDIWMV